MPPFPVTPPPTPIHDGAEHRVIDCVTMLAVDSSPQNPIHKSVDRESCILVTHGVEVADGVKIRHEVEARHEAEQKYERIPLDINQLFSTTLSDKSSELCYVEIDEFASKWKEIASTPGIYVLRKRFDGFYEVIVDASYIPLLRQHDFQFLDKAKLELRISYDPTKPAKREVDVYGRCGAERRSYILFLENAFEAIWSRRSRGLRLCLRSIAPPYLRTALEWAILSCDILESSPLVRGKFTLCLVLLALNLLDDYNAPTAIQLLEKNQDEVLQAFRKDPAGLFEDAPAKCQGHKVGLVRRLLILAGGPEDLEQHNSDPDHTVIENLNLLGYLVDITGSNCLKTFDLQAPVGALYKSRAIINECIDTLDISELISQLMTLLSTRFQSDLGGSEVALKFPLSSGHNCTPPICPLGVSLLGNGVYQLEEGYSDRELRNGDVVKLRLGGILTGSTSQILVGDANVCLPSALENDRLMTLFCDYDGWYEDYQGRQCLSEEVLRVIRTMKVGQKVLFVEEKEDTNTEEEKEDKGKETRIWVVQILQVLRVCAGHLNFGQNVSFHVEIPREKPKLIKSSVRQRIRKKLEEPQIERRAWGLGRIFSFIFGKLQRKSSNGGYIAL